MSDTVALTMGQDGKNIIIKLSEREGAEKSKAWYKATDATLT